VEASVNVWAEGKSDDEAERCADEVGEHVRNIATSA
jgi:hypothetical protein